MFKKVVTTVWIVCIFLVMNISTAAGQSYSFQVPSAEVTYSIEADGTATIEYTYVFQNDNSASDIEFVDIGMPAGSSYDYSDMSAEIDGHSITHIQNSEYIYNGVEFGLGSYAIRSGQSGTFHALIRNISGTIFPGTAEEQETYAGSQFQPNYFSGGSVHGKTEMSVTIVLPPGLTENKPRYSKPEGWPGADEPMASFLGDRIYYRWTSADARSDDEYIFGVTFPARLIPTSQVAVPPAGGKFEEPTGAVSVNVGNFFDNFLGVGCCGLISLFVLWSTYEGLVGSKKRKMQYFPPKVSIEGHGIKRGLTAVEAAILLQQPMDKILTMILFAVVKKNAAEVVTRDPLEIKVNQPLPEDLRGYETDFLKAFEITTVAARRNALQDLMIKLINSVSQKMKGFSHKETVEYYKQIIDKAWEHIAAEGTPDVKMQNLEEAMDWTMADKNYEDRSRRTFTGPVYVPMWWGHFDPSFGTHSAGTVGAGTGHVSAPQHSGSAPSSMPHMPGADFAASMVNGVNTFAAGVIGNVTSFTSKITDKTNPLPKTSTGRSGGSHGGGCACACACASCACACAGGGR